MKSRKRDVCSAKEEKLNEIESCFQTTKKEPVSRPKF